MYLTPTILIDKVIGVERKSDRIMSMKLVKKKKGKYYEYNYMAQYWNSLLPEILMDMLE